MTSEPAISVLMTAYNRDKYIAQAIEGVLASTFTNFELIIVDDRSSDSTVEIARSYEDRDARVKVYINDKNLGDYPNRNKAAGYARGGYIKYLDSDDIMYPHCLQVMISSMEKFPEAGFGLSAKSDNSAPYPMLILPHEAYLEHFNGFGHFDRAPGSSIIKKEAFDKVGGFSGERMIGDNEMWFKIGRQYPLVKFQRDLVWDRMHLGQESRSGYAKKYERLRRKVLEEAFAHPACPLTDSEKAEFLRQEKGGRFKRKIKKWL
jgi:glycosyltransferase involved in cell wall biosynthesis